MLTEISTFEESNDAGLNISLAHIDTMILNRLFADLWNERVIILIVMLREDNISDGSV